MSDGFSVCRRVRRIVRGNEVYKSKQKDRPRGRRGGDLSEAVTLVSDGAALEACTAADGCRRVLPCGVLALGVERDVVTRSAASHPAGEDPVLAGDRDLRPAFGGEGIHRVVLTDENAAAGKEEKEHEQSHRD